jgi:hypothetical protein
MGCHAQLQLRALLRFEAGMCSVGYIVDWRKRRANAVHQVLMCQLESVCWQCLCPYLLAWCDAITACSLEREAARASCKHQPNMNASEPDTWVQQQLQYCGCSKGQLEQKISRTAWQHMPTNITAALRWMQGTTKQVQDPHCRSPGAQMRPALC